MAEKRPKIVIVDDSELVRSGVKLALEPLGFEVVQLDSPLGFSNMLRREQPHLALVDVAMPALNGDKLVEIARRHGGASFRILLFSDRPESELKILAVACGADGYLRKTGDPELLAAAVRRALR